MFGGLNPRFQSARSLSLAHVCYAANQVVSGGSSYLQIPMVTVISDRDGMWDAARGCMVVPRSGIYAVSVKFNTSSGTGARAFVARGAINNPLVFGSASGGASQPDAAAVGVLALDAGDVLYPVLIRLGGSSNTLVNIGGDRGLSLIGPL